MNQTAMPQGQRELKLQKTTIVKLDMTRLGQLVQFGTTQNPQSPGTTASTAPGCDMTTVSTTGII